MPASRHYWPAIVLLTVTAALIASLTNLLIRASRRERALIAAFRGHGIQWQHHQQLPQPIGIVNQTTPFAVTVGFLRPRIYLSRGLLRRLTKSEVAAVISHEAAHAEHGHPLLGAITQAIATTLRFFPWLQTWADAARAEQEIMADAQASDDYRLVQPLASALVKIEAGPVGAGAAWSPLEARLDRLLDPQATFVVPNWWRSIVAALVIVAGVTSLSILAIESAKATSPMADRCVETRLMCAEREQRSFVPFSRMSVYELR